MIIVTGGAGFIGSNIIKALNKKGITDIFVVDDLKDGRKFSNLVDLSIANYMDKGDFLIQIMQGKRFGNIEAIFHKGACSVTTNWNGKYMMNNNYQYSKELLRYCLDRRIPFLYASSAATYGSRTSDFIEDKTYEKPLNIYGYSKFLFDEYVRHVLPRANSQIIGLRYFNVYGPREGHKGNMASIPYYLNTLLNNGECPTLFQGSADFKRDFIYISDVVAVNLWFLERGISGIFNLGTGRAESFKNVAEAVLSYHKKGSFGYIPFPDNLKGYYQTFTQANLAKLRAVGYDKAFKSVFEGIREYMDWLNQSV